MIEGVHHIEIEASDAEEMVDFMDTLGFEERRRTEHHDRSFELVPAGADGPIIEIHTVAGEEVPGVNHVAFAVDDLDSATVTLAEADVDGLEGPHYLEETGRAYTNLRDPDGRRIQLIGNSEEAG